MKTYLISLPWSDRSRPSAAIASLKAMLNARRPKFVVEPRSEFLVVSELLGEDAYAEISNLAYTLGDPLYAALFYPEKAADVRNHFERMVAQEGLTAIAGRFDETLEHLRRHTEGLVQEISADATVVGFTTCFGQMFANLYVARLLKDRRPDLAVVLGGSTVSSRVGPSLMREYAFVDHIVQGEGEQSLLEIIDGVSEGRPVSGKGILSRASPRTGAELTEVARLDELPLPDYSEYAQKADTFALEWVLPLEGSRGCWWDRARETNEAKNTCYFCNLNVQWRGYREKTVDRVVQEVSDLTEKHRNLRVYFVDNIIRYKGVLDLAGKLQGLGRDLDLFIEARANLRPQEFLELWRAGLTSIQYGIEGLSTSLLKRIGKGTTTIQNLQAMRLCAEFGVRHAANLIARFPGATDAEVDETRRNLLDYALSFEPLAVVDFHLGMDSTVARLPDSFGITRIRNAEYLRACLPTQVYERLELLDLDYDVQTPQADWTPVRTATEHWKALARNVPGRRLVYRDGGSFLIIDDERFGEFRSGTFDALARDLYLFCTETRRWREIASRHPQVPGDELRGILFAFIEDKLMFKEGHQYLALAIAPSAREAERRMQAMKLAGRAEPSGPFEGPPDPDRALATPQTRIDQRTLVRQ